MEYRCHFNQQEDRDHEIYRGLNVLRYGVNRLRRQEVDTVSRSPSELVELNEMLNRTISKIAPFLTKFKNNGKRRNPQPECNFNLEVIYPVTNVEDTREDTKVHYKAPMTLLKEGRKELISISEKLIAEQSGYSEESLTSNRNSMMLKVLNSLRKEFGTCTTLLGTFMEAQVQIPLEKVGGDTYVNELAKHARSFGLSVWGLLVLPFGYLNQIIGPSDEFRQFVIKFSDNIKKFHRSLLPPSEHQFPDYDEKLEFLVGSMKQSWISNQKYVSYSLERQLQDQCKKRNIFHDTPVEEILNQWNSNFEDETLTLVPNEYRPLVARWIKWSLMINNLRENLASQTAVGVIGLVNSGKSKFVRSLFGEETITGTTDQKRTTVPLIYNLDQNIMGLDVIDFPGVDDRDKSIPELANLLLSLTRIIIFVVDYRRAHTESTKKWLSILEKEKVPVLVCLTFADKLYAELMGENGDWNAENVKAGVENQFKTIKEQIGPTKHGHQRDLKLTVFAFDNDSKLNTEEGKEKLRKAGLSDELDVGRWIAEKLEDCGQNDVSQNVIRFIEGKEKSTLNSNVNRLSPVAEPATERENGDVQSVQGREGTIGQNPSLSQSGNE
ncbi:uncharacterized protein LOC114534202 isoform X2 [Dendronephthya gigantea]|uniref:uncharacterized protein LOC114534202 isoform X2 n=1 Tax=Dendronephthya gigantea TaxID=151771 RepID=UPI001069AE0A|nr:uncharacterized protein LOC114534202 isoform X2 [Dendronephthya gigantea]